MKDRLGNALRHTQSEAHLREVIASIEKEKLRERLSHSSYQKRRYHEDIGVRAVSNWEARIIYYMRNKLLLNKPTRFGCLQWDFREHIESQMSGDMWWDNYGSLWEVDHVVPVCKFDLPREIFSCFHYTNLRPRLVVLNRIDGYKLGRKYWYPLRNS